METFRTVFPPKPTLTEKNLPDQTGKVRAVDFLRDADGI